MIMMIMTILIHRRGDIMQQSIQCSFMTGALTDLPSVEVTIVTIVTIVIIVITDHCDYCDHYDHCDFQHHH